MAKLTGQFTTPSFDENNDKTHKPLLHAVVFVFDGATKATRETDSQGKYSFDLANGEYEVSVYLKGSTEKDRFDMRAGEKFVVTTSTPTDALEKWLQVIGTGGKDELATYYENLLAQMQSTLDQFRNEASFIGSPNGKIMREGAYGWGSDSMPMTRVGDSINKNGFYRMFADFGHFHYGSALNFKYGASHSTLFGNKSVDRAVPEFIAVHNNGRDPESVISFKTTGNTTVDSNGFIKAASPVLRLFNDRIETNDQFTEEPAFEKIGVGTYKISNTLGLAQEGWIYEKPRGSDGQPYFRIKVEKLDDGCIVSIHDEYVDYEDVEIIDEKGKARTVKEKVTVLSAPRDIKDHERWIDLRFHEEPQEHHEEELLAEY